MKSALIALVVVASVASTGCANMTPEQNAAIGGAILGGLAVAGAVAAASRPAYYYQPAPVYYVPVRRCNSYGRCW